MNRAGSNIDAFSAAAAMPSCTASGRESPWASAQARAPRQAVAAADGIDGLDSRRPEPVQPVRAQRPELPGAGADHHPLGALSPGLLHGRAQLFLRRQGTPQRQAELLTVGLHAERPLAEGRKQLGTTGVEDHRAGRALHEIPVERRRDPARQRPR